MHTWYYRGNAFLTLAGTALAVLCAVTTLTGAIPLMNQVHHN